MPSILFVCTANQFRSPIATACLLKHIRNPYTQGGWLAESAGTWARDGQPAPSITLRVARQLGLDGLDRHVSRQIDQGLLDRFDLIIVMEGGQKEAIGCEFPSVGGRLYMLSEIVDGIVYDIPDPAHLGNHADDVGHELYMLIIKGKEKILRVAENLSKPESLERKNR
jgi:protein-tyrosine-phosphatase